MATLQFWNAGYRNNLVDLRVFDGRSDPFPLSAARHLGFEICCEAYAKGVPQSLSNDLHCLADTSALRAPLCRSPRRGVERHGDLPPVPAGRNASAREARLSMRRNHPGCSRDTGSTHLGVSGNRVARHPGSQYVSLRDAAVPTSEGRRPTTKSPGMLPGRDSPASQASGEESLRPTIRQSLGPTVSKPVSLFRYERVGR